LQEKKKLQGASFKMEKQSSGLPVFQSGKIQNSLPVGQSTGLPVEENTENRYKMQNLPVYRSEKMQEHLVFSEEEKGDRLLFYIQIRK